MTARGLSTSVIPYKDEVFEMRFDFIDQTLDIDVSTGQRRRIQLMPQPVCDFYAAVMKSLADLGIGVHIRERPCEIPDAILFSDDRTHASYDPDAAQSFGGLWSKWIVCSRNSVQGLSERQARFIFSGVASI